MGIVLSLCLAVSGSLAARAQAALTGTPAGPPLPTATPLKGSLHLQGQAGSQSGWFSIIWGDGRDGASQTVFTLTDDGGGMTVLLLDEKLAESLGGVLSFDRNYVTVQGVWAAPLSSQGGSSALKVTSISLAPPPISGTREDVTPEAVAGSKPWISIMCKFSDVPDEPNDLAFFQGMYAGVKPGLDHYWRELSYDTINLVGSKAVGWFVLPHPEAYYNPTDTSGGTDLSSLAKDCTGVADASVNFTHYIGINMMFNDDFDNGWAWGGGKYFTLDGVRKIWHTTWEPPWAYENICAIEHEMGHGFGLPHSSGDYGQTYDNVWDVMSDSWYGCDVATDPTYGCMGQHTISYHLDKLGWIPKTQKFTAKPNTSTTITLEQLALPQTSNYLMAQIPINGSRSHFYTVEARRLTGYDAKLPGNAVIIHKVDTTRDIPAHVIDADGNGDTGDAGAMWTVGETFSDPANGIYVYVSAATASGFQVEINNRPFSTISGHVRTNSGTGISGVVMNGLPHHPITDTNGYYSDDVFNGWSGTVTPQKIYFTFNPATFSYINVTTDQIDQNFAGIHPKIIFHVQPAASGSDDCQSWINACTMQNALSTANRGDEIWVASGTYKPATGNDRSATFQLIDGVALYGGFAGIETARDQRNPGTNLTILSGDIGNAGDDSDNSYHVVTGATGATLDGFTITAGHANGEDPNDSGGGMYNNSSSPTVTNVTFTGNSADYGGGMYNEDSNPTLANITFDGNSAVNNGGGMYNNSSNPILTNVTFSGNSAARFGGGMFNETGSNPALTNVTFSANSAMYIGGMVNTNASSPAIRNTILWGNLPAYYAQIWNIETTSSPVMSDSIVQSGCPAGSTCTNIITADPLLGMLGNYGGFTQTIPLLPGSSAFNTGNDATCAATDQRGIARPQGAHCDIGAFEVLAETTPPETTITGKPASLDNNSTPTLTFSGDDGAGSGVASFMCRMDDGIYAGCTSPFTSPPLADGSHTFHVYAIDMFGNADASPASCTWTLDSLSPSMVSIVRTGPNPTVAASVDFTVTFSEDVVGVDENDFTLTKSGTLAGESITDVSGGPAIYTVTVSTGTGTGTLRLDLPASVTITSSTGHLLAGLPYTNGESYSIGFYIFLPIIGR